MTLPRWLEPTWEIRWSEDRTEGEVWRMKGYWIFPQPPVKEGTIQIRRAK